MMNKIEEIKGFEIHICKECGRKFPIGYYNSPEEVRGGYNYCLNCLFGLSGGDKDD